MARRRGAGSMNGERTNLLWFIAFSRNCTSTGERGVDVFGRLVKRVGLRVQWPSATNTYDATLPK